jgi:hypothetical protein
VNALVWALEMRLAFTRTRELALWIIAPLSAVLVLATGAVPAGAGAGAYAALFAAFGVLSTVLPLVHDGDRGMTARVVRGGLSPASYLIQRAAAGATLATARLLPALLVASVLLHASVVEVLVASAVLVLTVWIGSLLGVMAAAMSRSASEALAFSVVGLLLLLHMSGVFRTPGPDGVGAALERASPFRALHEAFLTMVSGGAVGGVGAEVIWALGLPALVVMFAPALTDALNPPD